MDTFKETKERKEIIDALEEAKVLLSHAAEMIKETGLPIRADKTRDLAQRASDMKSLVAVDWHDQDEAEA